MYVCMRVCIHICIYIYVYVYVHTHVSSYRARASVHPISSGFSGFRPAKLRLCEPCRMPTGRQRRRRALCDTSSRVVCLVREARLRMHGHPYTLLPHERLQPYSWL